MQRIPIGHIAPDLRPESRQPRLLPLPEELVANDEFAPGFESLIAELRDLGDSLRTHQIQPIIVYPGTSSQYPAARYLILVGHRRWTAALLVGLPDLEAMVIDPPSQAERVLLQYTENEARTDFTDMERAWALQQMKQALDDAPWETVEAHFRMSTSRRHELIRLLTFTAAQQRTIAQLRLRENQVESMHQAARAGALTPGQIDTILRQIQQRAHTPAAPIDGMTIARLVAQAKRAAGTAPSRPPPWLSPFQTKITTATKEIKRLRGRFAELNATDRNRLALAMDALAAAVQDARAALSASEPHDDSERA